MNILVLLRKAQKIHSRKRKKMSTTEGKIIFPTQEKAPPSQKRRICQGRTQKMLIKSRKRQKAKKKCFQSIFSWINQSWTI